MSKRALRLLLVCLGLGTAAYAALVLSPWPTVWALRYAFAQDAASRNAALGKHVPPGVRERRDVVYGPGEGSRLDIYLPPAAPAPGAPLVVWVHGGGFVAGAKEDVAPYLRILAGRGHAAVGVGYRRAPDARYPQPVRQVDEALAFLRAQGAELGLDASRIALAGDSAGAQIAAQLALATVSPDYAARLEISPALPAQALRGTVLFCGVFDVTQLDESGWRGWLSRMLTGAYFGPGDSDRRLADFAIHRNVSEAFPPSFVSVGNGDAFAPQSVVLAEALRASGVRVETLFFPPGRTPALPHEYQFNLDEPAGREALERLLAFLDGLR